MAEINGLRKKNRKKLRLLKWIIFPSAISVLLVLLLSKKLSLPFPQEDRILGSPKISRIPLDHKDGRLDDPLFAPSSQESSLEVQTFFVKRVVDGDTIEIETGEKVRLIGIDTLEMGEVYYSEAKNKLKELVENKEVRLEKDVSERDKYGRLLRYVWLENTLVNVEMVRLGYAKSYTYPPDVKYQEQILKAQEEAREKKLGLWLPTPFAKSNCIIKGNISASGEKIYHLPGGAYYNKTGINEAKGERWFCSEEEAQAAGWRKSKL